MFERLIYTNENGRSVELSTASRFHCDIRKDVKGLTAIKYTVYRAQVIGRDGSVETGSHMESRDITLPGYIHARDNEGQDDYIAELIDVFNPFLTGILRYEGKKTRQIAVRVESIDDIIAKQGERWPSYTINLVALDPNWTDTASKTVSIDSAGTNLFYDGTKACGIKATITCSAPTVDMQAMTITNNGKTETVTFLQSGGIFLTTGDVLVLDTRDDHTELTLNGVNAFTRLDDSSVSIRLYSGMNTIAWTAHGNETAFTVEIEYLTAYLTGV